MTIKKYKGKKLRSTAQATNAPNVAGKMLGGTKWYLSAFHHATDLGGSTPVIAFYPPGFNNPSRRIALFKPFKNVIAAIISNALRCYHSKKD
jgi:hypothetical protein